MIDLYNGDTNNLIGSITDAELKFLGDALEKESADDQDYYVSPDTIAILADGQATDHLLALLRAAVGTSDGLEIRWERR